MPENFADDPGMQQWLIVPNLGIERMPVQRQRRLRKLPILIRADFYRRPKRHEKLQADEKRQSTEEKHEHLSRPWRLSQRRRLLFSGKWLLRLWRKNWHLRTDPQSQCMQTLPKGQRKSGEMDPVRISTSTEP